MASAGVIIRRRVTEPVIPGQHYPLIMTSLCDQSCSVPGPGPWSQSSPGSPPSLCLIFKIFLPGQWTNHVTLFVFSNTKKNLNFSITNPSKSSRTLPFLNPASPANPRLHSCYCFSNSVTPCSPKYKVTPDSAGRARHLQTLTF